MGTRPAALAARADHVLLAPSAIFTVTKTNDTADGVCDADCSLREAIIAANNAAGEDEVLVPAGWYTLTLAGANENLAATGDLDILEDLTLTGDGAELTIIDANELDRIFHVHAGVAATIAGVRVQNGEIPSSGGDSPEGGGIFSAGTLTVRDSIIAENAAGVGGGISSRSESGSLTITNTQVLSNAANGGGGLWAFAAALTIADSLFAYNSADIDGAGILSGSPTTIVRTTVAHNIADNPLGDFSFGGGLFLGSEEPIWVEDSQVYSNTAWVGGGLYTLGSQVTLSGTVVTSNTATSLGGGLFNDSDLSSVYSDVHLTLNDVTIAANTAISAGGGIANQGALTVLHSEILSNTTGQHGGGVYNGPYVPFSFGLTATVAISESLVSGNSAGLGGGLYNANGIMDVYQSDILSNTAATAGGLFNLHRLTIDNSTIAYNQASADAGGLASSGQLTLTNSLVADNQATTQAGGIYSEENGSTGLTTPSLIQNTTVRDNSAGVGGGLYLRTVNLDNSLVTSNTAQFGGGLFGAIALTVTNSQILTNTATEDGGGLYLSGGRALITATTVAANTAAQDGGGLLARGEVTLTASAIQANIAGNFGGGLHNQVWVNVEGGAITGNQAAVGGGVYNNRLLAVTGTVLSENQATLLGGGLATVHTVLDGADPDPRWYEATLSDATFADNSAQMGGGIFAAGTLTLSASLLVSNTATLYGGGLFRDEATPHTVLISATTFFSNTAFEGGGINNGAGHLTLHASEVVNNWADAGGGLFNGSYAVPMTVTRAVTITGSIFEGNGSFAGGGLANGPKAYLLLDGSEVVSNTAPVAGGLWNEGLLAIAGSTIAYNQASLGGAGGIANAGTLTLTHSLLAYNVSQGPGGGLWQEAGGGASLIEDSHIFTNTATQGGGVYVHSGELRLDRSTLAGNLAIDGGGLYNRGALTLTNATVSGNLAQFGGGLYQANQPSSQARLNNTTVAENGAGTGGGVYNAGGVVTLSNSLLADNEATGSTTTECSGTLTTGGYNLIESTLGCTLTGTAPGDVTGLPNWIEPLGDYGGATWTYPVSFPAGNLVNRGNPATPGSELSACETTDQRGLTRPQGGRCDIGAFENELPTLDFQSATYSVAESAGQVGLTVTLSGPSALTITVPFGTGFGTAEEGSDYIGNWDYLVLAPGQVEANINVIIVDDSLAEADETFLVAMDGNLHSLDNALTGPTNPVTVTIVDDDAAPVVRFGNSAYTATESALTAPITVALSVPSAFTITVDFATSGGTATTADYSPVSGTLTFAPGETSATFEVPLIADSVDEVNETVGLQLSHPSQAVLGNPDNASLTLLDDDDPPRVGFGSEVYTVTESAGTIVVEVVLGVPSSLTTTVNYATQQGSATGDDFTPISGTLTFPAGALTQTVVISLTDDLLHEGNETFSVALSAPVGLTLGTPNITTLTLVDDDSLPSVAFSEAAYSVPESEPSATVTVTLSAEAALTVTVDYATGSGTATSDDYAPVSGTLTFTPGSLTQTFTISVTNDLLDEANEELGLLLSSPSQATLGSPAAATLTFQDDDPLPAVQFSSAAYTATESSGTAIFTVTLSAASGLTVTVDYSLTAGSAIPGADYLAAGGTLTFAPGIQQITGTVSLVDDDLFEALETLSVTLAAPSNALLGIPATVSLVVLSDDPYRVYLPLFMWQPP